MVRRTGMAREQLLIDTVAQSVTTHYVAGTPVVTARLHTGRVLRCVGFMDGRSAAEEMRGWLLWLAMGVLCCACGGPEFKAGALALQGDAEAPAEAAADVGGGAADSGAGDDGGGGEDAAPEAEAGQVCGPITSDASPIGCFGPLPRPSQFGLEGPDGGGCSGQATPAECQCAQTYNCACIAAHAIACAGSGAWVSCAMVDGVPVVRCSAL